MAGFHSGLYKTGMATWNIYKRKKYAGCTEVRVKLWLSIKRNLVLDLYGVSFLYERIEDRRRIDYNIGIIK